MRDWKEMSVDERKKFVAEGSNAGQSASQMAALVTSASRNSIIGFAHRHNIQLGAAKKGTPAASPLGRQRKAEATKVREKYDASTFGTVELDEPDDEPIIEDIEIFAKPEPVPETEPEEITEIVTHEFKPGDPVNFDQLTSRTCKYPLLHSYRGLKTTEMFFCGHEVHSKSWCQHHSKLVHEVWKGPSTR